MGEVIAALVGAAIGGAISFASAWGLQAISSAGETRAVREQVASLMRMLEARMIGMLNHDKWFAGYGWDVADLIVARAFSKEGTTAFSRITVTGESFFSASAEIQRRIVEVRNVIERLDSLKAAVRAGEYYQTGPAKFEELFRELRSYAGIAQTLLRGSRAAIGDHSVVPDPIAHEPPARQ
jgi:glutathione S-transferase